LISFHCTPLLSISTLLRWKTVQQQSAPIIMLGIAPSEPAERRAAELLAAAVLNFESFLYLTMR
jgi:hypothetical protein